MCSLIGWLQHSISHRTAGLVDSLHSVTSTYILLFMHSPGVCAPLAMQCMAVQIIG